MMPRYSLDDHFFDSIDTLDKAYWLGFSLADGCIYRDPHLRFSIRLSARDEEHLQRFANTLGWNGRLYHTRNGPNSTVCVFRTSSKVLCHSLLSKGWFEFKRFGDTRICNLIPKHLISHLMRGLFDGDGSLVVSKRSDRPSLKCQFSFADAHKSVVDWYAQTLHTAAGTSQSQGKLCKHAKASVLLLKGNRQVLRIMKFLYEDGGIHLPRKHSKASEIPGWS